MSQATKKDGYVAAQQERSRRKLDFGTQRFKGKTFYLDLPRYAKVEELKEELIQRGATLEEFFHREVKYLVTQRNKRKEEGGGKSDPSTLSPATPGTTRSVQISPFSWMDSPGSVDSISGKKLATYETRAQKMMRMAQEKQKCGGGKMDIVTSAQQWGCKVIPLEALLKELKRLKPLPRKIKGTSIKVRSLRLPFLKVEDKSLKYRPLVYEMTSWPLPLVPSNPTMGPYDSLKPNKREEKGPQSHGEEPQEGKPGYCEPCAVRYQSLCMHLQNVQHKSYAQNPKNFVNLDYLISQGTSLAAFIDKERKRLQQQERQAQQNPYHPVIMSRQAVPHQECGKTPPQTTPPQYYMPAAPREETHRDHLTIAEATPYPPNTSVQEAVPSHTPHPVTTPTAPPFSHLATPTPPSLQRATLPSPLQLLATPTTLQATPTTASVLQTTPTFTSSVVHTTPTLAHSVKHVTSPPSAMLTPPPLYQTTPTLPHCTPSQKTTPTSLEDVPETPEKQPFGLYWTRGGHSPLINLERVFGGCVALPPRGLGTSSPALQGVASLEACTCRRSPRLIVKKERVCTAGDSAHMVSPPPTLPSCTASQKTSAVP
eukprot:Em0024g479a